MTSRHLIRRGIVVAAAFAGLLVLAWSAPATADDVVADDQIVQGKLCVGTPCVNGVRALQRQMRALLARG